MRLTTDTSPLITILHGDSSAWTALGEEFDAMACGRRHEILGEICEPEDVDPQDVSLTGYESKPFVLLTQQTFGVRCTPAEALELARESNTDSLDHQIGKVFWNGLAGWDGTLWLTSSEVARSTVDVSTVESVRLGVATLIQDAMDANPDLDPLLHLGMNTVLQLGEDRLDALGFPYVVNSGYPINGIAVTGPVTIRIGDVQSLRGYNYAANRTSVEALRFAAFQFDPCQARLGAETS